MKSNITKMLRGLLGLALGLALTAVSVSAQQPSPSPKAASDAKTLSSTPSQVGEDAGDYTIISSIEFGYRGIRVGGNLNKYRSDLNYKAGPRVFDSSFLMRPKEGSGAFLDTLLVTTTGFGADPYGNVRINAENSKWFRFDGTYRRFKYFNYLNNLANPNTVSVGSGAAARPFTIATVDSGRHGYDVKQQIGDFDLTILPKNERISFTVGFSPERYSGLTYTTYHAGGGEFFLPMFSKSSANDFRVGADWKLGPVDFSFLQGFRRFTDDSAIDFSGVATNYVATSATNLPTLNTFVRQQPVKGNTNYSRFSMHTFLAKKLDITGRVIYSSSTSSFDFLEKLTGSNYAIIRGNTTYSAPNVVNNGVLTYTGDSKRPSTTADFGVTYMPTDKLRISNTFRFETYQIGTGDFYTSLFNSSKNGAAVAPLVVNGNFGDYGLFKFRKITDTVEGDYQISKNYSFHFGYRYGSRREEDFSGGYALGGATAPTSAAAITSSLEENRSNVFFGGFKARPVKNWTLYFDAERGTADNIFTRWGEYNFLNFKVKSRYVPSRKLSLNMSLVTKNNSDPSSSEGVSLADFGVSVKSRVFNTSIDYTPNARIAFSGGYTYNWLNSDAIIYYAYAVPPATTTQGGIKGHSLYYVRNNYFYFDTTAQISSRVTFYAAYRINKDNGQGDYLGNPVGGFFASSYPMSYQSPEGRLAIRLNRQMDLNLGYQYYNYRESLLANPFPQNYHAHLPYASLRIYFGRGRG